MRSVILQMSVSLDGYVAMPDGNGDWGVGNEHEAVTAWKLDSVRRVGTHIMGRVTYQAMAAHWPTSTSDYAAPMNDTPKVVFSRSLATADWPESRIARGNLTEEIDALRQEPGGDIMAHGGATFVQALSQRRLIDEYRLVIRAVALGSGLPLFADLSKPLPLSLVSATTYPDGTAIHVYRPTP
ncbi:MAG TPA: dihydrofolate reductase family protein [Pseudonocardiaceae bacterium]